MNCCEIIFYIYETSYPNVFNNFNINIVIICYIHPYTYFIIDFERLSVFEKISAVQTIK